VSESIAAARDQLRWRLRVAAGARWTRGEKESEKREKFSHGDIMAQREQASARTFALDADPYA
jgi:hypothetical protein